jgi:hypothetical protein
MNDRRIIKGFSIENIGGDKASHQFESLSSKIIGAAIKVHKELARPPRQSEQIYRLYYVLHLCFDK